MSRYIAPIEMPQYDNNKSFEENKKATIETLEAYSEQQRQELQKMWR